jgi:hypothetical protein
MKKCPIIKQSLTTIRLIHQQLVNAGFYRFVLIKHALRSMLHIRDIDKKVFEGQTDESSSQHNYYFL